MTRFLLVATSLGDVMKRATAKTLILLTAAALLAACSDSEGAKRVLSESGYSQVQITGYEFFSCADSDEFTTGFNAKGPTGLAVHGAVCRGWLKGSTVRLN